MLATTEVALKQLYLQQKYTIASMRTTKQQRELSIFVAL